MAPDIKAAVAAHIAARWTERDGGCPMCGCNQWAAHGTAVVTLTGDAGERVFPAAPMTCAGCGFVAMLNLQAVAVANESAA